MQFDTKLSKRNRNELIECILKIMVVCTDNLSDNTTQYCVVVLKCDIERIDYK